MPLSLEDKIELLELPARYGDAMDDRNWPALEAIFTQDATSTYPIKTRILEAWRASCVSWMRTNTCIPPRI
jgi:hypothetical protein